MDRFDYIISVLDPLVWKCDMGPEEIHDMLNIMTNWLHGNITNGYKWYTPPYGQGLPRIEYMGTEYYPCLSFEFQEDLEKFKKRFGILKWSKST